jgi:fructose 1,6-bisphosphatase
VAWDRARALAQEKADWMRQQAPFGVGMASQEEIAYTGLAKLQKKLSEQFELITEETAT